MLLKETFDGVQTYRSYTNSSSSNIQHQIQQLTCHQSSEPVNVMIIQRSRSLFYIHVLLKSEMHI